MPIDYTTLFTRLGRLVKVSNDLIALQGTYRGIGTQADDILDEYEARRDLVEGLLPTFDSLAAQMAGQVGQLKSVADRTLADLQLDLNAPDSSPATILERLVEDMAAEAESVNASTVSDPTIAAVSGATGNGQLVASKIDALGREAEISLDEIVRFTCTGDQYEGSASAGGESFSVVGYPTIDATAYGTRGNGNGQTLSVMDEGGDNLLDNGNLDTITSNVPDNWTLDAGTAGTNVFQETSTVHVAGGKALKLQGNGALATATLSQSIADEVDPVTRYVAAAWLRKGAGTFAAGSTLTVRVTDGTNHYNLFSADPTTLTTSFALKHVFFSTPEALPSTLKFEITWTSAGGVASTGQIFIDDAVVAPAYEFGGIYYGLFRGSTDFTVGDAFMSETAITPGVLQEWFGRFYGVQLPSNAAGAETIADSLAT